ncbi:MAG: DUF2752 domain-containing protein [Cytophagales bacterium]|nr:MAG: DUF2752 domain-containing protein [Cytophagales bacterium]
MMLQRQFWIYYFKQNTLILSLIAYLVISVLLKSYTGIDFTIPCPYNYFLGIECYGCGLTTACTKLAKGDLVGASQTNWLVFIVLPTWIAFMVLDLQHLYQRFKKNTTE